MIGNPRNNVGKYLGFYCSSFFGFNQFYSRIPKGKTKKGIII